MTRDNSKLRAAFPVHLVVALVAALVLVPFSSAGGASAAGKDGRFVSVEGRMVNLDDPDQPVHCLLYDEGRKVRCFGSVAKADAHAAKMDRAARLVKSGRMSAAEVEDGVTAAACTITYRYYWAIKYGIPSLAVCHEKSDLSWVCDDDPNGNGCWDFNDDISSIKKISADPWCTTYFDLSYYRNPSRWTCQNIPDLRVYSWNDRISSISVW